MTNFGLGLLLFAIFHPAVDADSVTSEIELIHGNLTKRIPFPEGRLRAPNPDITVLSNDT